MKKKHEIYIKIIKMSKKLRMRINEKNLSKT